MIRLMVPAALVTCLFAVSASAATIKVDVFTDSAALEHQKCGTLAGDCTLRAALNVAKTGDVIELDSTSEHIIDSTLVINKSVSLLAAKDLATITTQKSIQLIRLDKTATGTAPRVTLQQLTLTGGGGGIGFGGAIGVAVDAELNIISCVFSGNSAVSAGAIHWNAPGSVFISDSVFEKNVGGKSAGAIFFGSAKTKISIQDSTFRDNQVVSGSGEGGAIVSAALSLSIEHSSLLRNTAGSGSAISVFSGASLSATLQLNFVTIARNLANKSGAISVDALSTVSLANTLLGENTNGDCVSASTVKSFGFNLVEAPGDCLFKAAGDITGEKAALFTEEEPAEKPIAPTSGLVPACKSAAVDRACASETTNFECSRTSDALGFLRPIGKGRDIGAVESPLLGAKASVEAPDQVTFGEDFAYAITVTNLAFRPLHDTQVEIVIPSAFSVQTMPTECSGATTLTCTASVLAGQASKRFSITLQANAEGTVNLAPSASSASCLVSPIVISQKSITVLPKPVAPVTAPEVPAETPTVAAAPDAVAADVPAATAIVDDSPLATVDELFVRRQQPAPKGCSAAGDHSALVWLAVAAFLLARRRAKA